jgi:hypothetical protein
MSLAVLEPAPADLALAGADALAAAVAGDVSRSSAVLTETLTYLRLLSDHAKFIRNGFDQTQEALFREGDALAQAHDRLRARFARLPEPLPPALVAEFARAALPLVRALIQFKDRVAALIDLCLTQQTLPAPFVRHLRREADFFVGTLNHLSGLPVPQTATLDLRGPAGRTPTVARALLGSVPVADALAAGLAYAEFWGKHHEEHAEALMIFLRPEQRREIAAAGRFRREFRELRDRAAALQQAFSRPEFDSLSRDALTLTGDWRSFLVQANTAQRACALQANFPQRLSEHIRIETDILTEAIARTQLRLAGQAQPAGIGLGAVYTGLTPKEILLS